MLEKIVAKTSQISQDITKFYDSKAAEIFNEGGFADSVLTVLGIGINATLMYSYLRNSVGFIKDVASQFSRFY